VYYFFDSLQGSQIGIIKGMGLQTYGTLLNIFSTWVISVPVSAVLANYVLHSVTGVWIGLTTNTIVQALVYIGIIFLKDFKKIS